MVLLKDLRKSEMLTVSSYLNLHGEFNKKFLDPNNRSMMIKSQDWYFLPLCTCIQQNSQIKSFLTNISVHFVLGNPTFSKSWLLISCNQLRCSWACKKLASCPCWATGWDNSFPRFPFSKYHRKRKSEKFWRRQGYEHILKIVVSFQPPCFVSKEKWCRIQSGLEHKIPAKQNQMKLSIKILMKKLLFW